MKRFTLTLVLVGLVVAACTAGASPTSTATAIPSASQATATAAPPTSPASPTPQAVTAAVAFDGKACTYAGPTDLARGSEVTFSLVNTAAARVNSRGGALVVGAIADGTTREQIVKDAETGPADQVPPYFLNPEGIMPLYPEQADKGETVTIAMNANLYFVGVGTAPEETNKMYVCTLLKVFDR